MIKAAAPEDENAAPDGDIGDIEDAESAAAAAAGALPEAEGQSPEDEKRRPVRWYRHWVRYVNGKNIN